MSKLPPVSCGAMVRIALPAMASAVGTAPAASGGITMPPRPSSSASRATMRCRSSCEGATPITPMNGAPGMRTPGSCGDWAKPLAISQCTRKGVVKRSRRKPKPGMIMVKPRLAGTICSILTARRSPGWAPSTCTGPVSGWTRPISMPARSAAVVPGLIWPSSPSSVSISTDEPEATRTAGAMSGCQRLWPLSAWRTSGRAESIWMCLWVMLSSPTSRWPSAAIHAIEMPPRKV